MEKKTERQKSYQELILRTTIKHFIVLFGIIMFYAFEAVCAKLLINSTSN